VNYHFIVKPEAEEDIKSAFDWYEEQQPGLGDFFIDEVDLVFDQILNSPKSYQERYKKTRINFTNRFPFGVHYSIEESRIVVLAVLHTSKDPKNWRE
jgi:toxin ParE1/3/4